MYSPLKKIYTKNRQVKRIEEENSTSNHFALVEMKLCHFDFPELNMSATSELAHSSLLKPDQPHVVCK